MTRDKVLLFVIVATWPVAGLIEPFAPSYGVQFQNEVSLVHAVVLAVLLLAWCKAHASVAGITTPTGARLAVALLPPVGLPYYFFRAFPWRPALIKLGKALLAFLVCAILYAGGLYLGTRLVA